MKVLYDHQTFQMQYFGGVSKSFCELISHLPEEIKVEICIVQSNNVHLRESGLVPDLKSVSMDHKIWNKKHPGKLMDVLYLAANRLLPLNTADSLNRRATFNALKNQDFDVFHPTYYKPEVLKFVGKKPLVMTIHDMMPELFPQYYSQKGIDVAGKRLMAEKAAHIVAVSQNTKEDAMRILGLPEEKITVIHHGGPKMSEASGSPLVDGRYFLYVGQRTLYKRFIELLECFSSVAFRNDMLDVRLVCTGSPITLEEQQIISSLKLSDRIIHIRPSDSDMANLYANALAFVYPSAYEGFGMPILEAFAAGCPCLLNNASCFPEVAGDAAVYFKDNLDLKLVEVASWNQETRKNWQEKGYDCLSRYSWKKSAEKLAEVYKKVI